MKELRNKNGDIYKGLQDFVNDSLKDKKNIVGIEIGCFNGESTRLFIDSGKFSKLYCIDPYDLIIPDEDKSLKTKGFFNLSLDDIKGSERYFDSQFKDDKRIVKLKGFSKDFVNEFEDNSIDFIYIDGDHSAKGVYNDISNYFSKIKDNGIIGFHDYDVGDKNRFELIKTINEYFGMFPKYVYKDDTAFYVKNEKQKKDKVIFTITDNKTYKQSLLMIDTFMKHNNDYDTVIFLYGDAKINEKYSIIRVNKYLDNTYKKFNTIEKIKAFRAMATMACLDIYKGALYVDADVCFYGKVPEYSKTTFTLHKNHGQTDISERCMSGFINLGYYYANKDEDSINWFKIVDEQYKKNISGITSRPDSNKIWNQTFYNFIYFLFSNFEIENNDCINVAPWNLDERKLSENNGEYKVNGDNLICFHFSKNVKEQEIKNDIYAKLMENYRGALEKI